ncbi:MAG: mannose transporter subunit [Bacillales bacterium]|jgi:PTS system mannose-specific IIA component|nr:mannose transporter subunit [Bacillales bacterium]
MHYIFVSHGDFAQSILESAQMIVGEQTQVRAFGLHPNDDITEFKEKIEGYLSKLNSEEIICFTDLFSGSPFNVLVSLMGQFQIQHVTGMNLPLILEAFVMRTATEFSKEEIVHKILEQSKEAIIDVNDYLENKLIEGEQL